MCYDAGDAAGDARRACHGRGEVLPDEQGKLLPTVQIVRVGVCAEIHYNPNPKLASMCCRGTQRIVIVTDRAEGLPAGGMAG